MGIRNLKVILNQKCKNAINVCKLDKYRGYTLGIDLSIFLYKYIYNNGDHIEGLTRLILRLLKNQITPLFVFDGKPPEEKNGTIQERKEKKEIMNIKKNIIEDCIKIEKKNYEEFKENVNDLLKKKNKNEQLHIDEYELKDWFNKSDEELKLEAEKIGKKIIYVKQHHIESCKKLFDLFGIKYIQIEEGGEAEGILSMLCKNNIIGGVITEDSDILANGGGILLKNFSSDKNDIEENCLEGILNCLELTQDEFIDFCILCGCDYTEKIPNLGPMNAIKVIHKYKNIEKFLENNDKYVIPANFLLNYEKARYLFNQPIPNEIYESIDKNTKMKCPDINNLLEFLKKTKLKEKHLKEIENDLMNYFINIDGVYEYEKNNININVVKSKKKNNGKEVKLKKITEFFKEKLFDAQKKELLMCGNNE
jgi:flap endonuclease-1